MNCTRMTKSNKYCKSSTDILYKGQEFHYRHRRSLRWSCPWVMFHFSFHFIKLKLSICGEKCKTDHRSVIKGKFTLHTELVMLPNFECVFKAGPKLPVWASQWNIVGFYSMLILHCFQCFQQQACIIYYISILNLPNQQAQQMPL